MTEATVTTGGAPAGEQQATATGVATPTPTGTQPAVVAATGTVAPAPDLLDPNAAVVTPPVVIEPPANVFPDTGNAALNLALDFFGKAGLSATSPEIVEAEKGNFAYLEAKLATLGDKAKGWENYLAIAKEQHAAITGQRSAALDARRKVVHEAVGGEVEWKAISEFVNTNADPAEKEEIKSALSQGGQVARAMALMLKQQYDLLAARDPKSPTVSQSASSNDGGQLTLTGYRNELGKLVESIGASRVQDSPAYAALKRKYAGVTTP